MVLHAVVGADAALGTGMGASGFGTQLLAQANAPGRVIFQA